MSRLKILFLYPNGKGMTMLPPGISLLSAVLKREGFVVDLFDTTQYDSIKEDGEKETLHHKNVMESELQVRPAPAHAKVIVKYTNVFEDFRKKVLSVNPDLIAMSVTENMFNLGIALLKKIKDLKILTLAGGIFPTSSPKLVLSFDEINIVCKGEGEASLPLLCRKLEKGENYDNVTNLHVKKKNGDIKVNPTGMINMDENPLLDVRLFEESRFFRPMSGKIYKMFPVETHRGCPYKCAFCNSPSTMQLYKTEVGVNYLRRKSFENMRKELLFYKNEMKAEYLYFWADTFFSWSQKDLETFAEIYQDIKLPFWCQTRPETITKKRIEIIQAMGLDKMSLGVEHGNYEFRKKYIDRQMPNQVVTDAMNLLYNMGVRITCNNIIGFPYETRKLAFDTIRLNRTFKATDRSVGSFIPFQGTALRKISDKLGYTKPDDIQGSITAGAEYDMPQFSRKEIRGLVRTFNYYCNFPEERWNEIKKAEEDTPDGNKIYEKLKKEFVDKYWSKNISFEQSAAENDPHATLPT